MEKRKTDWGRVLHRVGFWGLMLLILSSLALLAPRWFGMKLFSISSGSMAPEISRGSLVFVEDTDPTVLQTGDVIVFAGHAGDGFVTHRVVRNETSTGKIVTKGDANAVEDPMPVDYSSVFGRVKWHLPLLGFVVSPRGKAVYVVLFLVLLGLMTLGQKGFPGKGTEKGAAGAEET